MYIFTNNKYKFFLFLGGVIIMCFVLYELYILLDINQEGLVIENEREDISANVLNNPNYKLQLTGYNTSFNEHRYEPNNYDVQYHNENIEDLYNSSNKISVVKDPSGKLIYMKWKDIPKHPTYLDPSAYVYGPSTYVPSYEDTVLLKYNTNKKDVQYAYLFHPTDPSANKIKKNQ